MVCVVGRMMCHCGVSLPVYYYYLATIINRAARKERIIGCMKPTIAVVRAVGVRFVRQTIRPLLIAGALLAILLVSVGGWLTTQSAWWWLLEALCIAGSLVFVALTVSLLVLLRVVDPAQTTEQKQAVKAFVAELQWAAETLHTPQPVIIYRVVRDIVRPRSDSFIATTAQASKALAADFAQLRRLFS